MDALGIILRVVLPLLVVHLVALAAIVAVMKKLLLNDTVTAVDTIKQVEADVRKKEEGIRKEIEEHEKEFEKSKAEAATELEKKRKHSEEEVAAMREQTITEAKQQGEKIIEQAKKNEENFKQQLALEMEAKTVDYAGQVFKLVFSEKTTAELNKEFISELLDALDEVEAGTITVEADNAEFISSHPIADEQKVRLEKIIEDKFGVKIKVEETVQEDLLAGLIIKMGTLEVDASLLNRYQEAVGEVKKNT